MRLKQKKSSGLILSDKIADALTVKPRADIEDDNIFNTKPNTVSRADYSSDSEDEAAISDFRKRNVNLLSDISKKYEGTVVSRKDLEKNSEIKVGGSSDEESLTDAVSSQFEEKSIESDLELSNNHELSNSIEDNSLSNAKSLRVSKEKNYTISKSNENSSDEDSIESDEDSIESDDYSIIKTHSENLAENSSSDENSGSGDGEESEGYDISQMEEPLKDEFKHVKKQNISEEAKKGACVRNQLLIWENLLEMRIHMQRCINTANMMPLPDKYVELKSYNDFHEESNSTVNNVANVLDKFLVLQNLLLQKYPETKSLSNVKQKDFKSNTKEESDEEIPSETDNEEIPSDTDTEDIAEQEGNRTDKNKMIKVCQKKRKLEDYESDILKTHKSFKKFRDTTIQKWNEKTRLATAATIKNAPTNTILQQISYILSDRNKLIRRTQLKRSDYEIVGYQKTLQVDKDNIEEQIETEINAIKDRKDIDEYIPEIFDDSDFYHQLLRELIECKSADISDPVQLSRQWIALQQMRSKMKRKVDTRATKGRKIKYVVHNQLVSYMAPEKSLKWNDESTNELYSSLFGKMFEQNNVGINVDLENVKIKE